MLYHRNIFIILVEENECDKGLLNKTSECYTSWFHFSTLGFHARCLLQSQIIHSNQFLFRYRFLKNSKLDNNNAVETCTPTRFPEFGDVVKGSARPRSWRGTKGAASTLPELPTARTGLILSPMTLRNVVYRVVVGFCVVVLGPFRDKITSSQFHFGSINCALAYGQVLP